MLLLHFPGTEFEAHRCCFKMSTYDIGACQLSLDLDKGWHVCFGSGYAKTSIGLWSSRILPFQASCEPQISVLWKDACSKSCGYHAVTFYVIIYLCAQLLMHVSLLMCCS